MRYIILLTALIGLTVYANLPPTQLKGANEAKFSTTFNFNTGTLPVSRTGTTVTFGTMPVSGGGTGSTSFASGTVVYSNGTQLTGNVNQMVWTGSRFGIGTSAPTSILDVHSATDPIIQANGTEAYNANGGGTIQVLSTANGAITSGSRLGAFQFGGDLDASGTEGIGAAITATAEEGWSASSLGTGLRLKVTKNGQNVRSDALNLNNLGILTLPSYAENGVLTTDSSGGVSTTASAASGTILFSTGTTTKPVFRSLDFADVTTALSYTPIASSAMSIDEVLGYTPLASSSAAIRSTLGYTPATSGVPWATSGTTINYLAGNVGIGTAVPSDSLAISGTSGSSVGLLSLTNTSTSSGSGLTITGRAGTLSAFTLTSQVIGTTSNNDVVLSVRGANVVTERIRFAANGNVGLRTGPNPTAGLDVSGTIRIRGGGPQNGYVLTTDSTGAASWTVNAPSYSYQSRTTSYTAVIGDIVAASGTLTVTLPTAVGQSGKQVVVNNIGTSQTAIVNILTTSSQTIGTSTTTLIGFSEGFNVTSDGTNWQYTNQSDRTREILVRIAGSTITTTCTSSPCLAYNLRGPITTITRAAAGDYTTNFPAGTFSTNMSCTCTADSLSNIVCDAATLSATQVRTTITIGQTAVGADSIVHLKCWGPR